MRIDSHTQAISLGSVKVLSGSAIGHMSGGYARLKGLDQALHVAIALQADATIILALDLNVACRAAPAVNRDGGDLLQIQLGDGPGGMKAHPVGLDLDPVILDQPQIAAMTNIVDQVGRDQKEVDGDKERIVEALGELDMAPVY